MFETLDNGKKGTKLTKFNIIWMVLKPRLYKIFKWVLVLHYLINQF